MTEHRDENDGDTRDARLEALYREADDVEPDAGLDRMIRARAEEAVDNPTRSSNRLPWLGGLVTASVAVVAIAVVIQQSPPGQPSPEVDTPLELSEPEAFMSPSVGADAALKSASDTRRAPNGLRARQSAGAESAEAASPPSPATRRESAQSRSEENRAARPGKVVTNQAAIMAESARSTSWEHAEDADATLARIELLIEQTETERARQLLATFRRQHPNIVVPDEIVQALANSTPHESDAALSQLRTLIEQSEVERAKALLKKLEQQHPDLEVPDDIRNSLADTPINPENRM